MNKIEQKEIIDEISNNLANIINNEIRITLQAMINSEDNNILESYHDVISKTLSNVIITFSYGSVYFKKSASPFKISKERKQLAHSEGTQLISDIIHNYENDIHKVQFAHNKNGDTIYLEDINENE